MTNKITTITGQYLRNSLNVKTDRVWKRRGAEFMKISNSNK